MNISDVDSYTRLMKQFYEILVKANETSIAMVAPGVRMSDISKNAKDIITEGLVDLGLIKNASELSKFYYHGLGHNIGLDVHDVGGLGVLKPGMVITIEPGIYSKEESMGFRIEDCILVTDSGYKNLSAHLPKTVKDIEDLMKESGMDFKNYKLKK